MKKIAIFGANGNLGREIALAFHNEGWKIRAVTRDGKFDLIDNVEAAKCDCMDRQEVIDAATGCDFIFNAVNPYYPQWHTKCIPLAQNMMEAAKATGAVHLFPGNVYNYGTKIPTIIKDETPQHPDIKKGKLRRDMEAIYQRYAAENGVQTIILRAGDFFGSSKTGTTWFDLEITKRLKKGILTHPGPVELVHSFAYLPDMAQTFVKIARNAEKLEKFEAFLFRGHAVTGHQFKQAMERVVGKQLKTGSIPWPMLRILATFVPLIREVFEMKYLWFTSHEMDETRLCEAIGEVPHTNLEVALVHSLEKLEMGEMVKAGGDGRLVVGMT